MTTYFALQGTLTKEDDTGDPVPLTGDELEHVLEHVLHALNVYSCDSFRFVDVDSSATLTTGVVRFEWSDYA